MRPVDALGLPELIIPCDADLTLDTDRLELAPMVEGDSVALYALLRDPEIHAFTGGQPPELADELRAKIRRRESRRSPQGDELWLNWTLRLKENQTVVGYVQAGVKAGQADMAWVIGVSFQRRGYATEASQGMLEWLRDRLLVDEVRANIHPNHIASHKVARSIGLSPSGEHSDDGEEDWRSTHR